MGVSLGNRVTPRGGTGRYHDDRLPGPTRNSPPFQGSSNHSRQVIYSSLISLYQLSSSPPSRACPPTTPSIGPKTRGRVLQRQPVMRSIWTTFYSPTGTTGPGLPRPQRCAGTAACRTPVCPSALSSSPLTGLQGPWLSGNCASYLLSLFFSVLSNQLV